MHDVAQNANPDDARTLARARAARRAERFDVVVAMTLLVLLIVGWAIRLTPFEQWPRGDFQVATNMRHT
jgi:hypothetical protein